MRRPTPSLGLDRRAQARRGGPRVGRNRTLARPNRAALDRAQQRLRPADADRKVRRTRAAALAVAQELLHDPVLERMEADHRKPTPGPQHLERRRQCRLERAELVVDGDPESLKDALGGMTLAEPHRSGHRGPDRLHEVARPLERLLLAPARNRAGNLLRVALLAVAAENCRQ